ncbi:Wzz/FepE/Etk N-terminal domain-containing protein [Candidatus Kapabacteria bacterium]|nr:Wzz/FepE/Etk N-terminal domain-containing protein [Candidatus Kapabacteria bacterium]
MDQEIKFSSIVSVLKKNTKYLIAFNLLFVSLVMAYSFIMPQSFSASTSIMPPAKNSGGGGLSSLLNNFAGGSLMLGASGSSDESMLYEEILQSRSLLNGVIDSLKLDTLSQYKELDRIELIEEVAGLFEVESETNGFMVINTNFNTPYSPNENQKKFAAELSARIGNISIDILDNILIEKTNSTAKLSVAYISSQIDRYKVQLDSVANELEQFQSENKVLVIEDQVQAIVTQAIEISTEIAKFETELNLAKIEFSPSSKRVKILEQQVNALKEQAKKIEEGGITDNNFSIPLKDVPRLIRVYAELFRDRKVLEQVILYLETQRHEESIQQNKDTPILQVLDEAVTPQKKSYPKRSRMLIAGLSLSIVFSILFLFIYVYIKK